MKRWYVWASMLFLTMTMNAQTGMNRTATQIAADMAPGWNLGNTLEAGNNQNNFTNKGGLSAETYWQPTKTTKALIDYIKQLGFKSVRIPCAWVMGHISDATTYKIDANWMARVKEIVDYCIDDGLYVVLNDHWDGGWLEGNIAKTDAATVARNKEVLSAIWKQIAETFKDYDEHLLFAGLNEPNVEDNPKQTTINNLRDYEQTFIDAVRSTGGNNALRTLVVQGPSTNIDHTCNLFTTLPTDVAQERLMLEVHYYAPWQFWGMDKDESWSKVFYYWGAQNHVAGSPHNPAWGEESYMKDQLDKVYSQFSRNNIPVLIGEYGVNHRDISSLPGESQEKHEASIRYFYYCLNLYSMQRGMVPMVWDTNYITTKNNNMTVVNRSQLSIHNQCMYDGIMDAVTTLGIESSVKENTPYASSATYTLQGVRCSANAVLASGIYIREGKKVVIR